MIVGIVVKLMVRFRVYVHTAVFFALKGVADISTNKSKGRAGIGAVVGQRSICSVLAGYAASLNAS